MKLLFFLMVTLMTFTERSMHAWPDPTRGGSGVNLSGKMFTLSRYYGSLVFYSPYEVPPWATSPTYQTRGYTSSASTPSYTQTNKGTTEMSTSNTESTTPNPSSGPYQQTTRSTTQYPWSTPSRATSRYPWSTTRYPRPTTRYPRPTTRYPWSTTRYPRPTTRYPRPTTRYPRPTTRYPWSTTPYPWSTPPSTRGVSVCLRYVTDSPSSSSIFTLSPSSQYLRLEINGPQLYLLTFKNYNQVYLQPQLKLWPYLTPNMWTSICLTLDNTKGVVQLFRDSDMSSRKLLNNPYVWSGERVMEFSNFEGQITDVQMWDYPLRYQEVLYYMSSGGYGSYQGSVLSWSHISYSQTGRMLLEDSYEQQLRKPSYLGKRGQRNHLKRGFKPKKIFLFEEHKIEQWKKEM